MGIDFEPLFHVLFFAIGFVPVIIIGAVFSAFIAIPLWAVALSAVVIGLAVDAYMFWFAS